MKKIIIALIVIVLLGVGIYLFTRTTDTPDIVTTTTPPPAATPSPENLPPNGVAVDTREVIGKSLEGRDLSTYFFGTGAKKILFVGGLHGGYEWNTTLVAYELMDYLEKNPAAVPMGVQVAVIPVANPDGLNKVVDATKRFTKADITASQSVQVSGRYNARTVDLNRNFDCDWQSTGKWQGSTVSGGSVVFSEPESLAIKQYVESYKPTAVVVFFSAAGGVFSSSCNNGILPETATLTDVYAKASGYPAYKSFDFYTLNGDMTNWLAKQNIPTISVLLSNHTDTEWTKNQAGVKALLEHYSK